VTGSAFLNLNLSLDLTLLLLLLKTLFLTFFLRFMIVPGRLPLPEQAGGIEPGTLQTRDHAPLFP
jgi:hypothetical protein